MILVALIFGVLAETCISEALGKMSLLSPRAHLTKFRMHSFQTCTVFLTVCGYLGLCCTPRVEFIVAI